MCKLAPSGLSVHNNDIIMQFNALARLLSWKISLCLKSQQRGR